MSSIQDTFFLNNYVKSSKIVYYEKLLRDLRGKNS